MFWDGRTEENSWVSVGFYFLSKSWQSKDQLLFSFSFLVSVGFPRLLVSFVALLTSSSSSPERGVSWCSCSGGGGHFLPLCMLLAVSLASLWGQRPNQVSECRLKQHFRSQAGAGCHFWMASDVAQVKRDGTWCRDKADTSGWVTFSSWQMCCLELLFKTIKKKNTWQSFGLLWKQSCRKVKQAGSTLRSIHSLIFVHSCLLSTYDVEGRHWSRCWACCRE